MKEMVVNNTITYDDNVHSAFNVLQNYHGHRTLVHALPSTFTCMLFISCPSLLTAHMIALPDYYNMLCIRSLGEEISPLVHEALALGVGSRVGL